MKNTGSNKGISLKILLLPVIFLMLFKITFLFISSENSFMDDPGLLLTTADVSAQEKTEEPSEDNTESEKAEVESSAVIEPAGTDEFSFGKWGPDFINDLKLREDQITRKKDALQLQEQNLKKLKNQIEERIEQLVKVEKAISVLIAQKEQVESKKMKKLAKVFEATPPEQAGILMSKLDVDIAADLLINMNGRKAGKIWGFVDPDRAVLISNRLSEINPYFKIEAQK
jgi:flagellar motility protein MotE (MotC chaperone)